MITVAVVGAGIGLLGSVGGGIFKGRAARKEKSSAEKSRRSAESRISYLENSRQKVINPYDQITDLSGNLSNTFNNLGVATQAAEMQMEQTDIALANALDTIRATGGGAGGATALAQAALQSKKGVSASIEQQESANEKMRAEGEADLQQNKMAEQQRIQQSTAAGRAFVYGETEKREMAQLDRAQADLDNSQARKDAATQAGQAAMSDAFAGLSSAGFGMASAGIGNPGFGKK